MNNDEIDRSIDHGPRHWWHLVQRFFGSLSSKEPSEADQDWALGWLLPTEGALWRQLGVEDKRHTLRVARAYLRANPHAERDEMAAALLHDIGKIHGQLSTLMRVAAKVVGPRTRKFKLYHDHEEIGADMLRKAGSSQLTITMIDGSCERLELLSQLLAADNA